MIFITGQFVIIKQVVIEFSKRITWADFYN